MAHLACFLGHAQLLLREGEAAVGKVAGRHGDAGGGAGLAQHRARADRRELELIETLFLGKVIAQNLETGRNRHSRQNPNIERKVASTSAATGCDSKPTAPRPQPHTCTLTAKGVRAVSTLIPVSPQRRQTAHLASSAFPTFRQIPPRRAGLSARTR